MSLRLFIAIDLPEEVKQEVTTLQRHLKEKNLIEGTFVHPEHTHITLKFIGDVDEKTATEIDHLLKSIQNVKPMQAQLKGLGVFYKGKDIKVLFVEIACHELSKLVYSINQALKPSIEIGKQTFVSHATIARIKKVNNKEIFLKWLKEYRIQPIDFVIDSFVLKESILHPKGPEHKKIERYMLE